MDAHSFDTLAKAVAQPPSRRQLLRLLGGGGLAALAVRGETPALAQSGPPCTFTFTGTVRVGPSAGQLLAGGTTPGELRGTLTVAADPQGDIAQGRLAVTGGPTITVVGQISGRAINLRLALNAQQVVVAVGTAAEELATCQGAVDGVLTGPQLGDLGDWHLTASGTGVAQLPGTATASGATGSLTQPGAPANPAALTRTPSTPPPTAIATATTTATSQPTATATPQPTATTIATAPPTCGECQQPGNGGCVPMTDNTPCSAGRCCVGVCVDQATDANNCGSCNNVCTPDFPTCINGACSAIHQIGGGCPTGQTACGDTCVDIASDGSNCGACGNVCPSAYCVSGQCQPCGAGYTHCGDTCSNVTSDPTNCGACGNACSSGQICFGGNCATDHR